MISDLELKNWCDVCATRLADCRWRGEHPDTDAEARAQVRDAVHELDRCADSYVRWPWAALDEVYGGMGRGQLHYVVGFSGLGKSTFIASAILRWAAQGQRVVVLPLEVRANVFRTYLACQSLGIDPGLMLSGDYHRREDAPQLRVRVKEAVFEQATEPFCSQVIVHDSCDVSVDTLRRAAWTAEEAEADILVIDHVDHLEADRSSQSRLYETSVAVNRAALRIAQDSDLVIIAMSQANQEALRGTQDQLAKYAPLRDNCVLNGGTKRQIASGMLGLYRPQLSAPEGGTQADVDAWKEIIAAARRGDREPQTALEPCTMGVNLMKSRSYGGREGKRIMLAWQSGRIVDREVLPYILRSHSATSATHRVGGER
jgi:KaiC/GvpD/RAD55 family RecA-like ATPase